MMIGTRLALVLAVGLFAGCTDKDGSGTGKDKDKDKVEGDDTSVEPVDADSDGYTEDDDCDDTNPEINPGAVEVCDGIDNNCDDLIDDPGASDVSTWFADSDGDGYGDAGSTETACDAPAGFIADNSDCDDDDASISPGAVETCNAVDDDCNEIVDDLDMDTHMFVTVDDKVNDAVYKVDISTGELTEVSALSRSTKDLLIKALATSDTGGAWFHDTLGQVLYSMDICDGSSAEIGATGDNYLGGMTLGKNGEMYAVDIGADTLVKVDPATAAVTVIGEFGMSISNCGLTYMCQTDRLILVNPSTSGTKVYQVDPETAATNLLMETALNETQAGAAYDPSTGRVIVIADDQLVSLDVDAGTAETISTSLTVNQLDNLGLAPICE